MHSIIIDNNAWADPFCCGDNSPNNVKFEHVGADLPATLPCDTTNLYVDIDSMVADLDITDWCPPACFINGLLVVVRKIDTSANKIIFNQSPVNYAYAGTQGELISFRVWKPCTKKIQ